MRRKLALKMPLGSGLSYMWQKISVIIYIPETWMSQTIPRLISPKQMKRVLLWQATVPQSLQELHSNWKPRWPTRWSANQLKLTTTRIWTLGPLIMMNTYIVVQKTTPESLRILSYFRTWQDSSLSLRSTLEIKWSMRHSMQELKQSYMRTQKCLM